METYPQELLAKPTLQPLVSGLGRHTLYLDLYDQILTGMPITYLSESLSQVVGASESWNLLG